MNRITKISTILLLIALVFNLGGCAQKKKSDLYAKEDAANTSYGKKEISSLYIDDFYFLTVGTKKSTVEVLLGSAQYHTNNDELSPVYTLENGDKIAITYDSKEKKNAVDIIYAAVGYELLENDIHEAEQLAKDYIDSEKLELREIMEEYHGDE